MTDDMSALEHAVLRQPPLSADDLAALEARLSARYIPLADLTALVAAHAVPEVGRSVPALVIELVTEQALTDRMVLYAPPGRGASVIGRVAMQVGRSILDLRTYDEALRLLDSLATWRTEVD